MSEYRRAAAKQRTRKGGRFASEATTPEQKATMKLAREQRWLAKPGNRAKQNERVAAWESKPGNGRGARKRKYKIIEAGRPPPAHCEICGEDVKLFFDHDHISGLFRGWLCHLCNVMLGMAKDNPERLRRGANYLEAWSWRGEQSLK